MRELSERGALGSLSAEVLSAVQLQSIGEPLLPNLKTLLFWGIEGSFVPFIPLFLSPNTTSVSLALYKSNAAAMVASTITITIANLPRLCPSLQEVILYPVPRNPAIAAAVSGMVRTTNRNALRRFHVESTLTLEASEVLYTLPNLHSLSVVIEREDSLPPASLPNLTTLAIKCDDEGGWPGLFQGATFGKLESVIFYHQSKQMGDFLGTFEKAACSSSIQNTLSVFNLLASCSWSPNYSSLLSFTQLADLVIEFSCGGRCSSTLDDDIIIDLSRAMPKLERLRLGKEPCNAFTADVTTKGLVALACHCPNLIYLCIHFQVVSLCAPTSPRMTSDAELSASWKDCALTQLVVGEMSVPEESALTVAQALLRIFPRIATLDFTNGGWKDVEDAIHHSG